MSMFLSFLYKTISPLRNKVHSGHHLAITFGQENYEDKVIKQTNIYILQTNLKIT